MDYYEIGDTIHGSKIYAVIVKKLKYANKKQNESQD
jgi:hypothetical protein